MPVVEAMACGVPVIAVNFGGHLEMCNRDTSYLVNCTVTKPPPGAIAEGLGMIRRWAETEVSHLRYQMRRAFTDRDEAKQRGRAAQQYVSQRFTWEHTALAIVQAVNAISLSQATSSSSPQHGGDWKPSVVDGPSVQD